MNQRQCAPAPLSCWWGFYLMELLAPLRSRSTQQYLHHLLQKIQKEEEEEDEDGPPEPPRGRVAARSKIIRTSLFFFLFLLTRPTN